MTTTPACPDQTTENIASYDSYSGQLSLDIPSWVCVTGNEYWRWLRLPLWKKRL